MADNGRIGWSSKHYYKRSTHTHTTQESTLAHAAATIQMTQPNAAKTAGVVVCESLQRSRPCTRVASIQQRELGCSPPPRTAGPAARGPLLPFCLGARRTCLGHSPSEAGLNRRRTGHLCAPCNTRRGRAVQPRTSWLAILRDLSGHLEQSAPSSTAKVPLLCGPVTRLLKTPSLWGGALLVKKTVIPFLLLPVTLSCVDFLFCCFEFKHRDAAQYFNGPDGASCLIIRYQLQAHAPEPKSFALVDWIPSSKSFPDKIGSDHPPCRTKASSYIHPYTIDTLPPCSPRSVTL